VADEIDFGYLTQEEALAALGITSADDPKLAALAGLSWGGNSLKFLRVNATENGWEFATAVDSTARVPEARTISTTAPLVGGGDLSADRTLSITAATAGAAGSMSAADKTKLNGVASWATANSSDATLLARGNHTGTQAAATIIDFAEALDDRVMALLAAGANISLSYDDAGNVLTIAVTGLGSAAAKNTGTSGDAVPVLTGGATTWAAGSTWGGNVRANGAAGSVTSVRVDHDGASLGGSRLERATGTGIVAGYSAAGVRQWYIGFPSGTRLAMVADGANTGWDVTGDMNVSTDYKVDGVKVLGNQGAALPADATDLATAIALANAIKARLKVTGGHGLVAD
jgi:hypothetical protein